MSTPTYQLAEDLIDDLTASVSTTTASQTYTIGNLGSGLTYSNTAITGTACPNVTISAGSPFTFSTGTNTAPWFTQGSTSAKINLEGKDADIVVNGSSLVDAINSIQDRLNCLQINPKLEAEWDELKALGDQYRKLEKQILEKQATWDLLKAMPPPEID
jgi:hypothetical protein